MCAMKQEQFQPQLTPAFVAEALGLSIPGLRAQSSSQFSSFKFTGLSIDYRTAQPGQLFVAIKGEKFDGHDFIPTAITQGVKGIICQKDHVFNGGTEATVFAVDDTLAAYRKLSGAWRRQFSIPLILVAGSAGKTTTKEFLAALLKGRWPQVLKTTGSQNGFVGIPLTLLELKKENGAAVIEVGIDEIGAMDQHLDLIAPTGSIVTSIGPEHMEKLRDIPTVAREEGLALTRVDAQGGLVAINLDDPWLRPYSLTLRKGNRICYSLEGATPPPNAYTIKEEQIVRGRLEDEGQTLIVKGQGLIDLRLTLPLLGKHNATNLLGAVAVARGLGLDAKEIQAGLQTFQSAPGRSEIKTLPLAEGGQATYLCDYYNSQPPSVVAALNLLTDLALRTGSSGIRWACLGDMLELGKDEEKFHRDIAGPLHSHGVDTVLLYGDRMKWLQDELGKNGFKGKVEHFGTQTDLANRLRAEVKNGDVVLLKGSRGMKMEEVWKALAPT